jgi:hypothetical protein
MHKRRPKGRLLIHLGCLLIDQVIILNSILQLLGDLPRA